MGQTAVYNQFSREPSCFPQGLALSETVFGDGDAGKCTEHVDAWLKNTHKVDDIIKPILKDNTRDWYAAGGPVYTTGSTVFNMPIFSNGELREAADNKVCKMDWSTLANDYPKDKNFVNKYCLYPSYYYALLVHGYGLSRDTKINTLPAKNMDWTLAVVLTNNILD